MPLGDSGASGKKHWPPLMTTGETQIGRYGKTGFLTSPLTVDQFQCRGGGGSLSLKGFWFGDLFLLLEHTANLQ